ncbi:MAG: L-seryl-tRNA(Sec) selenium transferase [candidate division Zixibacteria bacterium]|nr:L-seryl-tRNA(Sec) selenium transferase [candidate division Zixibacteria bacterium]
MAQKLITKLRDFPSIDELLSDDRLKAVSSLLPRQMVACVVRQTVERVKYDFSVKPVSLKEDELFIAISDDIEALNRYRIQPVINATGIVVHTNLGRSPLSESVFEAIKTTIIGYSNVEFDIEKGARGSRGEMCESYLALLSDAESGTVVNNCAAALFIILNTLANKKDVIISRGELVQIGGGFRIPDILKRAGAKLVEVGTTNITYLADYALAITDNTGLILKVHKSNFIQAGFSEEVPLAALVELGRSHEIPVCNDLGSGVFVQTEKILGYREPTVQQSVRAGVDLTCFSGDKMLGGVQSGLIVGNAKLIAKIKRNPLFRALRVDKIVFAVLEKLLSSYLSGTYMQDIKLWQILSVPESELYKRAKAIEANLGFPKEITVTGTKAYVGGGALPEADIPSVAIRFSEDYHAQGLAARFRRFSPPIIGRVENNTFLIDIKAVDSSQDAYLTTALRIIVDRSDLPRYE